MTDTREADLEVWSRTPAVFREAVDSVFGSEIEADALHALIHIWGAVERSPLLRALRFDRPEPSETIPRDLVGLLLQHVEYVRDEIRWAARSAGSNLHRPTKDDLSFRLRNADDILAAVSTLIRRHEEPRDHKGKGYAKDLPVHVAAEFIQYLTTKPKNPPLHRVFGKDVPVFPITIDRRTATRLAVALVAALDLPGTDRLLEKTSDGTRTILEDRLRKLRKVTPLAGNGN